MVKSIKQNTTRARAKQNEPSVSATTSSDELTPERKYVPLFPLLAKYWDKRLSELPEKLRARVSMQKEKILVGQRPKFDASGELECNAEGHYPVYEDVYTEHETGDWIISWDALTPEQRQIMARQIDDRHDPANENERHMGRIIGYFSIPHEWDYWAEKPTLVADEAIPLMNGLDPGSWRNRIKRMHPKHPLPDDMVSAITRGLQIAEADGSKAKSPTEWLAWGRSHGLDKPTMKSDHRLREPDICMWPLFARVVAEVESKAKEAGTNTAGKEVDTNTEKPNADYDPILQKLAEEEARKLQVAGEDNKKESVATKVAKRLDKEEAYKHYRHLSNQAIERRIRRTWKLNRAVKLRP